MMTATRASRHPGVPLVWVAMLFKPHCGRGEKVRAEPVGNETRR